MAVGIKGSDATVQWVINGDLKGGSFSRITNLDITPRTDIMESDFLGEALTDLDYQHHGYDFSFEMQTVDRELWDMLFLSTSNDADRVAHPAVNMIVTLTFPDGEAPLQLLLASCFVKVDSLGFGGRKERVLGKVSGKCKTIEELG